MSQDCTEWQNTLLFWWRLTTTAGVVVLSGLVFQYRQKISNLVEKNKRLKTRIASADSPAASDGLIKLQVESDTALRQRKVKPDETDREKSEQLRKIICPHNGYISNEISSSISQFPEIMPVDQPTTKLERSEIVIENPGHVTHINNQALLKNSKYKITKIVTTVEVTLQPGDVASAKIDTVSTEQGSKIEDSVEEETRFESTEQIDNIKSMLEATNTHSVEEIVEKVVTLESVIDIIREAGLETSNLIFGIDYTASNKYQGANSFYGKSLHAIEKDLMNPYQQVISVLGKTLAPFATSGFIAGYGFGDAKTEDRDVFPLKTDDGFCKSFNQMLDVYNKVTAKVILSGPTNFAPLIYEAIKICKQVKTYHILVIVADGQVTNEPATRDAIVEACKCPLSIIVVGVGDGPWQMMRDFDESLPKRTWDNFTFVEFHKLTMNVPNPESAFAVRALIEIPDQYKKIKSLGLLEKIQSMAYNNSE